MTSKLVSLEFFPDQDRLLLEGKITATLRMKKGGIQVGDCFYAGRTGLFCQITSIIQIPVGVAANMRWWALGYDTPDDFLAFWRRIHPRVGDNLMRNAFLISFELVKEYEKEG